MTIERGFIKAIGINYRGELKAITKKGKTPLHPIYEAFTNSLEVIGQHTMGQEINIKLYLNKELMSDETQAYSFQKFVVEDTGRGFEKTDFERLVNLRDETKNFNNRGTGRVQYLHFFDKSTIESVYKEKESKTGFRKLTVTLSKAQQYIAENSFIHVDNYEDVNADKTSTVLCFTNPLESEDKRFYENLTAETIKQEMIHHYMDRFCENRNNLPKIGITLCIDGIISESVAITVNDIPTIKQADKVDVNSCKIVNNTVKTTENKETFDLKVFVIDSNQLAQNKLMLISKGEIAQEIYLDNILKTDIINGNRYLFLLSGKYIDDRDSVTRGVINIAKKDDFKKYYNDSLFQDEEVLLEDLEEKTNQKICDICPEIAEKKKEKDARVEELQKMFFLNRETIKHLSTPIKNDDDDETILRKVYQAEARSIAERDAKIRQQVVRVKNLLPNRTDYQSELKKIIVDFTNTIPEQNRASLTQYVARRRIVLDVFENIMQKIKSGIKVDEDVLHNLVFRQGESDPRNSDLWLVNEDFIYFKGSSETELGELMCDGQSIFKADSELTQEEKDYKLKQNENAALKRPDILLFPKEGKCIILELKAPNVNTSEYLNQITRYASLINNLTKDEFKFTTYYGYLLGEKIDIDDIRDNDSDFKTAFGLDFIFRPYKSIVGKFDRPDGSLYTEILKYSTLLKRAQGRNKIFIDFLDG